MKIKIEKESIIQTVDRNNFRLNLNMNKTLTFFLFLPSPLPCGLEPNHEVCSKPNQLACSCHKSSLYTAMYKKAKYSNVTGNTLKMWESMEKQPAVFEPRQTRQRYWEIIYSFSKLPFWKRLPELFQLLQSLKPAFHRVRIHIKKLVLVVNT